VIHSSKQLLIIVSLLPLAFVNAGLLTLVAITVYHFSAASIGGASISCLFLVPGRSVREKHPQCVVHRVRGLSLRKVQPRNRRWTRPRVRLIGCLPRSNDAQGPGPQKGARAESLPRQRLCESNLPLAGAKAGVPSDA